MCAGLTARVANMVRRRQDMSFGSPGIVDAVVRQCGKIRWCGVVV
jgi:hypothetical protein